MQSLLVLLSVVLLAAGDRLAMPAAARLLTAIAKLVTRMVSCPSGEVAYLLVNFLPWLGQGSEG